MGKKYNLPLFLGITVGAIIGGIGGYKYKESTMRSPFAQQGFGSQYTNIEMKYASGVIKEIKAGKFSVDAMIPSSTLGAPVATATKWVESDNTTRIVIQKMKTPQELQQDKASFKGRTPTGGPAFSPFPIKISEGKFSDLKVGDRVTVQCDVDIRNRDTITARQITVLMNPSQANQMAQRLRPAPVTARSNQGYSRHPTGVHPKKKSKRNKR